MYIIGTEDGHFLKVNLAPTFRVVDVLYIKDAVKFANLFDLQLFSRMLETKNLVIYEVDTQIDNIAMPDWFILAKISFGELCR